LDQTNLWCSAWQVNTDLQPFDIEVVKNEVENGNQQKKTKALWEAYQIAAEGRDLAYFKEVLENHEKALQVDAEEQEVVAAKKQEKKDKAKRKSTTNADDDMDMEDVDDEGAASAKKAKPSKKRKKGDESDGEPEKVCCHCRFNVVFIDESSSHPRLPRQSSSSTTRLPLTLLRNLRRSPRRRSPKLRARAWRRSRPRSKSPY
jgi:hypothetical protein